MTNLNDLIAFLEAHAQEHASPYSYQILRKDHLDSDPRLDSLQPASEFVEVRAFSAGGHTLKATDANGRYLDGSLPTPPSQLVIGGQPIENQIGAIRDAIRAEERAAAQLELEAERKRLEEDRTRVAEEVVQEIVNDDEDPDPGKGEPSPTPPSDVTVEIKPRGRLGRIILGERS